MNTRILFLGLGMTVLFLSASSWSSVFKISTHPENIYANDAPEIGIDSSGNSYITWEGYDGNDIDIYWTKVDFEGNLGEVKKISTHKDNIDNKDWLPQIAVDASGNSYIVWQGHDQSDIDIYWTKVDFEGNLGEVKKISTHKDNIDNKDWLPQIAVDASGNSLVTWYCSDGNDYNIYWTKIDFEGNIEEVKKISTHKDNIDNHDYDPQIAVDASGNFYITWHGCDTEKCWEEPSDLDIYWTKIDFNGNIGEVKKIPPSTPDYINTMNEIPQIAVDPAGNSYIVWSGVGEKSEDIYWIKIDSKGNLGEVQIVSNYLNLEYGDWIPQIAVDASGNSYITWEVFDGDNKDIYWTKINFEGNLEKVKKISNYSNSNLYDDSNPHIAVDASGNSYITWDSNNGGWGEQFDQQIYWTQIDTSGTIKDIQRISNPQYSKHFDRNSWIAVNASGNCFVIFEGKDELDTDHIFFTAYLPKSTTTINWIPVIIIISIIAALIVIIARKSTK